LAGIVEPQVTHLEQRDSLNQFFVYLKSGSIKRKTFCYLEKSNKYNTDSMGIFLLQKSNLRFRNTHRVFQSRKAPRRIVPIKTSPENSWRQTCY